MQEADRPGTGARIRGNQGDVGRAVIAAGLGLSPVSRKKGDKP